MKRKYINDIQKHGLRLSLCAISLGLCPTAFAQTENDGEEVEMTIKKPTRQREVKDNFATTMLHGVVVDQVSKKPLAGIQLKVLGYDRYSAMTGADGKFTIKVPEFATTLFVHSPSFMSQQVAINAKDTEKEIKVLMMQEKFRPMYGEGTIYTAQAGFNADAKDVTIESDIENILGADVRTVTRSAAPGIGASMFVRGLSSINANAQPLIVVDGVEQDMQQNRLSLHSGQINNILANIAPEDIASVKVLKNATALYGARGGNGVILITTKRGKSMATRIDANISAGVSLVPQLPTMMNASQYRNYATEILGTVPENINRDTPISFRFLNDDPNNYYYHTYHNDTDWTDYVYDTAMTQNYNINVQGGDDIGMYNLSVGYVKAESTAKNNDFDRMNVRFNTDISILYNLTTKFDISISRTNSKVFDDGAMEDLSAGAITSPTFLSLIKAPIVSPYQYNAIVGGFTSLLCDYDDIYSQLGSGYGLANPVAILNNANGDNKNKAENTYFNVRVEPTWTINNNLSLTSMFSYTLDRNSQRYHRPFVGVPSFEISNLGTVTSMAASLFSKEINVVSDTHIDWKHQYGKHNLAAFGGFKYTYFSFDDNNLKTEYNSTTNDKNPALSASSGYQHIKGNNDVWKNLQWYGNVDYNYMNRYFATVSLSAEANSRFGAKSGDLDLCGVAWALFPSVQLGWVMTNESWFPKNAGINYLRVNAGYDMSGNDDISNYAARTSLSAVRFNYNAIGLQLTNIGNDEIKWETNHKFNVGLQAYMLNNRLGVDFNYYVNKTKDLLTLQTFKNPIGGINNYWTNGGEIKNEGFELSVTAKPVVTRNWNVEVGASVGHYANKVTKLPDGDYTSSVYGDNNILTSVGNPVGLFYGYKTAGVFATDAEAKAAGKDGYLYMEDNAGLRNDFKAGDVHFIDQNNDGKISELDKVVIGDPNPDIYGNIFATINYKNLTLTMGWNYSLGNDVYNYQRSILNSGSTFYNQQVAEVAHWRYEGQQTDLPRLAYGDPMGNNRFSDRWIEDGSYLRLKTLNLSYKVPVPGSWTWLQGLTVWAQANNLLTFTKYLGSDPEFSIGNGVLYQGIDCGNIAQGRSFQCGVKINL
ncbi:MAG: SusC/RagA family TonB-linked outer membrane protein [Prevotella sp.]|nr:SusC/RagA family TonB-linked outer membrane protein [Prevotella sp.]MDY4150006.1 SusC/RagA family TonB-linked outer membrane protein [Prevotella sp.]